MPTISQQDVRSCRPRMKPVCARLLWILLPVLFSAIFSEAANSTGKLSLPAWPPPPAEPKIVYVRDISGPKNIGAKPPLLSRMVHWLTGEGTKSTDLDKPFGLSLDATGNLLVTDSGVNQVCYLDFARKKWTVWKEVSGHPFVSPVAAVHCGKIFCVADSAQGKVIGFDEKGKMKFAITNELEHPSGLALLGERLVIADSQRHQIVICDLKGKFVSKFGHRGRAPGELNFPSHVSVDSHDRIYVTDSMNYRVQVFDATGKFLREFGAAGDGPGRFSRPKGCATDAGGHVYVVDALLDNVQIFDDSGRLLLDWGGSGSDPGKFWLPNAIAINSKNEIFVADTYNHRIQMFRYTGKP